MRRRFNKLVGCTLTAAMVVGLTACGGEANADATPTPAAPSDNQDKGNTDSGNTNTDGGNTENTDNTPVEDEGPKVWTDKDGNTINLNGMHVILRDWWSDPVDAEPKEPDNAFDEAKQEYLEWAQETYNFTYQVAGISTWASTPEDFVNYVSTGGDDVNYLFTLRAGKELVAAMAADLMYDLSTIDCLDFSQAKWNTVSDKIQKGGHIYAMSADTPEPKQGLYFNKRLLKDAGIEPSEIYDLQESGDWTWAKFEEICSKIQADTDNDGTIDRYAMVNFASTFFNCAVMSNYAHFVGMDENGKYVNNLETQETLDALNWAVDMLAKYDYPQPADSNWDYWVNAFQTGCGVFIAGETYQAGGDWSSMEDDFGFVCFPKGPNASDYTNWLNDNPIAIPACYDEQRAWNIAFIYNIVTEPVPGFEDYNGRLAGFYKNYRDAESVELTVARLCKNGTSTYHDMIPNLDLGPDLIWGMSKDNTPAQKAEAIRDTWAAYLDAANN